MLQSSGELFDQYYYAHNCGMVYERNDIWLQFFDRIAARIITDLNPQSVLDAGCALGFLVEGFRGRGVEAWGIDISEFAIQNVHASIKEYCWNGSITDPFPRKYDLIVSIEVLEHMTPEDGNRAIANLTEHTDAILISTSPIDYREATHFNVQQPDYWTRQFARYGFYRDVDYDATYITPWAGLYRRERGSVQGIVQAYERRVWQMSGENRELRAANIEILRRLQTMEPQVAEQQAKISELESQNANLNQLLSQPQQANEQQVAELQRQNQELRQALTQTQQQHAAAEASLSASEARWDDLQQNIGWKMLQKMQAVRVRLVPPGSSIERLVYRLLRRAPR